MEIRVKLFNDSVTVPTRFYSDAGDAVGYDLYTPVDVLIEPGETVTIPLQFAAAFPRGYVGIIFDRSSMGRAGIHRFAGVIEPHYRGEWGVILFNSTKHMIRLNQGDRIAQVIFFKIPDTTLIVVEELDETTRGSSGFGSTGK